MKKLVLGSLLLAALATQTTGCIIATDDDDPPPPVEFARIDADWSFHDVSPTGQVLSPNPCPTGFGTVELHTQLVDSSLRPIGEKFIDLFDCVDGRGFADDLEPGLHDTFIAVTTNSGGTLYANSLAAIVDVTDADKTFSADIVDNGGYFKLGWDLRDAQTNAPITCRDLIAGQDRIGVTATLTSNTAIFVADDFDCELGEEFFTFTAAVAEGTYDVAVEPVDSAGGKIGQAVLFDDEIMGDRNSVTELGVVTLRFP